jgi:hypothetical protein
MASLQSIREAIRATIIANLSGVEVYDTVPDVTVVPAVVVWPDIADFNVAMGRGYDRWEFDLYVLASRGVADEGQNALDGYISGAGSTSIRQVIWQNRTLGLAGTDAYVARMSRYGGSFDTAQVPHIGAVLQLVVTTPGTS